MGAHPDPPRRHLLARITRRVMREIAWVLIVIMDLGLFANPDEVRKSNDNMVRGVRETMKPVIGYPEATLPGTPEHRNEETHTREGVPIGNEELEILRNVASEWDVEWPEVLCP